MRLFKGKLYLILSSVCLSSFSTIVWLAARDNPKFGERVKRIHDYLLMILKSGDDREKKNYESVVKQILSDFTHYDLRLVDETLKKYDVEKVKEFCRLTNGLLMFWDANKNMEPNNDDDISALIEKNIHEFANNVDHDYVDKNREKVNERIKEVIKYYIPGKERKKDVLKMLQELNNNGEKIKQLWVDTKPLFDIIPRWSNCLHFMWRTRFTW